MVSDRVLALVAFVFLVAFVRGWIGNVRTMIIEAVSPDDTRVVQGVRYS